MIGWLKGAVRFRREGRLIIDVVGVGKTAANKRGFPCIHFFPNQIGSHFHV